MLHVALSCGISLNLVPGLAVAAHSEMEDPTPIVEEDMKKETGDLGADTTTSTETTTPPSTKGDVQ